MFLPSGVNEQIREDNSGIFRDPLVSSALVEDGCHGKAWPSARQGVCALN